MPTIFRDKVTIGSVTFNDTTADPTSAIYFCIDEMEGWRTTPEVEPVITPYGGQVDGAVAAPFFPVRQKYVMVGGYVLAASRADAEALWDVLVRDAFPRNKPLNLTRYESIPKFLRVRRVGPVEMTQDMAEGFRFQVSLVAADPFKYGLSSSSGSAGSAGVSSGGRSYSRTYPLAYATVAGGDDNFVALDNSGTADTPALATLHGPLDKGGWRLVNETTGKEIQFDVGLVEGDELVIDFRQQIATLNGFPITASVTGDFWLVQSGVNVIKLYGNDAPTTGFDIEIFPAWE